MKPIFENIKQLQESIIDYPRAGLDLQVWDEQLNGVYQLRDSVEQKIYSVMDKHPDLDLRNLAKRIHIVGSITTNQYVEDTDIDVHILPTTPWTEAECKKVRKWFEKRKDEFGAYVGQHPIEISVQFDVNQDYRSEGIYDMLNHVWVKGPKQVPLDYDPKDDFSGILQDMKGTFQEADELLGELKRDVIDFDTLHKAMLVMSREQQQKFLSSLHQKLKEIEDGIQELYDLRQIWIDARSVDMPKDASPEDILKDVQLARDWNNANAAFKFLSKYQYLKIIGDLQGIINVNIKPEDVGQIKNILGVN